MKNDDTIARMFIGAIRTNTNPIHIELYGTDNVWMIPTPDKQLGYELSLAIQNYYRRKKTDK